VAAAVAPLHILLVGGSGFLGGHAARGLLSQGHRVHLLSRGQRRPVPGTVALTADRRDAAGMAAAIGGRRFDLTVDFGLFDASDLDWLAGVAPASLGRLVMISSGQVYLVGAGATPPYAEEDDRHALMPEPPPDHPDHGQWSYGAGKRRAEQALQAIAEQRGFAAIALRLPTVQGEEDSSLRLWAWLERILDGGAVILPDGGRRQARYLYAGDLGHGLGRIATAPALRHTAYNLSQPDVMSLREFLERVAHAAGLGVRFLDATWEDCRVAGLEPGFLPYAGHWASVLDPARAESELAFVGTRTADYLPRIVRWHLEHRPAKSHEGYAQRARELELAARLSAARAIGGPHP